MVETSFIYVVIGRLAKVETPVTEYALESEPLHKAPIPFAIPATTPAPAEELPILSKQCTISRILDVFLLHLFCTSCNKAGVFEPSF